MTGRKCNIHSTPGESLSLVDSILNNNISQMVKELQNNMGFDFGDNTKQG